MQYDKRSFLDYYNSYLELKNMLNRKTEQLSKLLDDYKLRMTVEFYNDLNDDKKNIFKIINCNNKFFMYLLNTNTIKYLKNNLNNLYTSFFNSMFFPFSKDNFHFFIKDNNDIICAITGENSKDFNELEKEFLSNTINYNSEYDISQFTKNDISMLKVLYLKYKDQNKDNLATIMANKSIIAKTLDGDAKYPVGIIPYKCHNKEKIDHLKWKLNTQIDKIRNSDSRHKDILLFETSAAEYELLLLEDKKVTDILKELETNNQLGYYADDVFDYQVEALTKAYYNLTSESFRKSSGYFNTDNKCTHNFETANIKINSKILKMKKR